MLDRLQAALRIYWPKFSWTLFELLSHAKLMTLVLLLVTAVLCLASGARYRRRMATVSLGMLGAYWFMISPLFALPATHLLARFVPPDSGETADAIVVLARNSDAQGDRYDTALDLVAQGRASKLLIMGRSQGNYVLNRLDEENLSVDLLVSALCVRTTKDEAYSAGVILGGRGVQKIILITDAPHMLRSWQTFEGLGFSVIPHMEPLPQETASQERSILAIREYFGLISYAALGRFENRSAQDLPYLAKAVAEDFPPDRCFMTADQMRAELSSR